MSMEPIEPTRPTGAVTQTFEFERESGIPAIGETFFDSELEDKTLTSWAEYAYTVRAVIRTIEENEQCVTLELLVDKEPIE